MNNNTKLDPITEAAVTNLLANSNPIQPGKQGSLGTPIIQDKIKPVKVGKHGVDGKTVSALESMLSKKSPMDESKKKIVEQGGTFTWLENTVNTALASAGIPEEDWGGVKDTIYTLLLAGRLGDGTVSEMTSEAIAKLVNDLAVGAISDIKIAGKESLSFAGEETGEETGEIIPGEEVGVPDVDFEVPEKGISDDEGAFETQNFVEPEGDDEFDFDFELAGDEEEEPKLEEPEGTPERIPMELPDEDELKGLDMEDLETDEEEEDLDDVIDKLEAGEFDDDKSDDKKDDEEDEEEDDKSDDKNESKRLVESGRPSSEDIWDAVSDEFGETGNHFEEEDEFGFEVYKDDYDNAPRLIGVTHDWFLKLINKFDDPVYSLSYKLHNIFKYYGVKESLEERNRDGTGPEGKGPLTGRGKGSCGGKGTLAQRRARLNKKRKLTKIKDESISLEVDEMIERIIDNVIAKGNKS